jgi:hypothetical protein
MKYDQHKADSSNSSLVVESRKLVVATRLFDAFQITSLGLNHAGDSSAKCFGKAEQHIGVGSGPDTG